LAQAIEFIESISKKTQSDVTPLNENMSIRQGKYGPYIYYKTESMKKPQFFSLKKYDFLEKSNEEIIQWVQEKYLA
jgi:topoisomerase IA-like protein